jgi:hypothetical protein
MQRIKKNLLCAALFLIIGSPIVQAAGWDIPLMAKLAEFSVTRKLVLGASVIWTMSAIAHLYPAFKKDQENPKSNIFQQYRVSLSVAGITAGIGVATCGVYCWPHLRSLYF